MKDTKEVLQNYRLTIIILVLVVLTTFYYFLSDNTDFKKWFLDLYPEFTGAILIYVLLKFENKFFLQDFQQKIDKLVDEQESKIVTEFWTRIINKQTDVYIGRNKEDQTLSWTDIDAIDMFRKVLDNQKLLHLKHTNRIDENTNYSKTNIISIGGPKRNNISKEIIEKLSDNSKYKFEFDQDEEYQIKKGNVLINDNPNKQDYAIFYFSNQKNNYWTVFAGLTKFSTIASLQALLDEDIIKELSVKLNEPYTFLEVLLSFDTFGEHRINPKIVDINRR